MKLLQGKNFGVINLNDIATENNFILDFDKDRDTNIVDLVKINKFIENKYRDEKLVFIDGHLSHLLKIVDKIIILRCHPKELKKRLSSKNWKKEKIIENLQAEILDIILIETLEKHPEKNIFEIDTTNKEIKEIFENIIQIIENGFKPVKKYKAGKLDWSEEIIKDQDMWQ